MHDGHTIPQFGLGVYEMTDRETYTASKWALESGYRHIDTAEWYENESQCGKAIAEFLGQLVGWGSAPRPRSAVKLVLRRSRRFWDQT